MEIDLLSFIKFLSQRVEETEEDQEPVGKIYSRLEQINLPTTWCQKKSDVNILLLSISVVSW